MRAKVFHNQTLRKVVRVFLLLAFMFNYIPSPTLAAQLPTNNAVFIESPFGLLMEICTPSGIKYLNEKGEEVPFTGGSQGALEHCSDCVTNFTKIFTADLETGFVEPYQLSITTVRPSREDVFLDPEIVVQNGSRAPPA